MSATWLCHSGRRDSQLFPALGSGRRQDGEWICPWCPGLWMRSELRNGSGSGGTPGLWDTPKVSPPRATGTPWTHPLPSSSGSGIQAIPRNALPLEKATGMRHLLRGSCVPLGKDSLHPAPFSANIPDPGILPCWGFTNPISINIPKKSGIFCT